LRTITDETVEKRNYNEKLSPPANLKKIKECVCKDKMKCGQQKYLMTAMNCEQKCIPSAEDIDITQVSRLLYLEN